jgi:hypothetical protein
MSVPTLGSSLPSAEICRRNEWVAGDVLEGDPVPKKGWDDPARIRIVEVQDADVIAIRIDGPAETAVKWRLETRQWRKVEP